MKRRYLESGCDFSSLPDFQDFSPEALQKQTEKRDLEIQYHRNLAASNNQFADRSIAARRLSTEPEISNADSGCQSTAPRSGNPVPAACALSITPSMNQPILRNIPPSELQLHSVLDGFPELPPAQFEPLKASIAELGVMKPLFAIEADGVLHVFDGRHRRRAAMELELETVPVIIRDDIDPLDFAIESAATGRQLTKSGVVLMLFEKHPSLAAGAADRKAKNFVSASKRRIISDDSSANGGSEVSYKTLAERYQIPVNYFTLLAKIKFGALADGQHGPVKAATPEQWLWVKQSILEEEVAITSVIRGYQSQNATLGKHRADPVYLSYNPATGALGGILPTALTSVKNGFAQWSKLDLAARGKLKEQWSELQTLIPEDLK